MVCDSAVSLYLNGRLALAGRMGDYAGVVGKGRARWTQRWKGALNAFEIAFDGQLSIGRR